MKSLVVNVKGILILAGSLLCGWPATLSAQVLSVANLTPRKVYMKTVSDSSISVGETPTSIFGPTVVSCPSGSTCTIRVQVSAQGQGIAEAGGANAAAVLDGQAMHPIEQIPFFNFYVRANTYAWMLPNLSPGLHTVDVVFASHGGTVGVNNRILTVEVLKP